MNKKGSLAVLLGVTALVASFWLPWITRGEKRAKGVELLFHQAPLDVLSTAWENALAKNPPVPAAPVPSPAFPAGQPPPATPIAMPEPAPSPEEPGPEPVAGDPAEETPPEGPGGEAAAVGSIVAPPTSPAAIPLDGLLENYCVEADLFEKTVLRIPIILTGARRYATARWDQISIREKMEHTAKAVTFVIALLMLATLAALNALRKMACLKPSAAVWAIFGGGLALVLTVGMAVAWAFTSWGRPFPEAGFSLSVTHALLTHASYGFYLFMAGTLILLYGGFRLAGAWRELAKAKARAAQERTGP